MPGTYEPSASTTGPTKPLRWHAGDYLVSTDGPVLIEGLDIEGQIRATTNTAGPITARNCKIRIGTLPAPGVTKAALQVPDGTTKHHVLEDCIVAPTNRSVDVYGVHGRNISARRCDISGVVDGGQTWGDSTVEANFVHDLPFYEHDPRQRDGSHGDGWQYEGGGTYVARGNAVDHGQTLGNVSIILTQNAGKIVKAVVDRNWLRNGDLAFVASQKGRGGFPLALTGNRTSDTYLIGGRHVGSIEAATFDAMASSDNLRADGSAATFYRQP